MAVRDGRNSRDSFTGHGQQMKIFYKTHPRVLELREPRYHILRPLDSLWGLYAGHTIGASGGSSADMVMVDWLALVPIWEITQKRFSLN